MAEAGEKWVEEVLKAQGYKTESIGNEDIFAFKENLGVVIEEKDWKDPVKVHKNNIYQRGSNGGWYYKKRSQVVGYAYQIKKRDAQKKIYRHIISVYVFSKMIGRRVQPIYFRKAGTIFCVSKDFFPVWLKALERVFLGVISPEEQNYYMGGK